MGGGGAGSAWRPPNNAETAELAGTVGRVRGVASRDTRASHTAAGHHRQASALPAMQDMDSKRGAGVVTAGRSLYLKVRAAYRPIDRYPRRKLRSRGPQPTGGLYSDNQKQKHLPDRVLQYKV